MTMAVFLMPLVLAAASHAKVVIEEVEYRHGGQVYRGYLAFNDAFSERRPGVLVCHEWWGCNDYARERASKLAALGYVAFALDMYGDGRTTSDPAAAGQWAGALFSNPGAGAIAGAGFDVLRSHPRVDGEHLAAIGYCMGGTVALELARTGAPLDAVVTFHTSNLAANDRASNRNISGSLLICHGADDTFVTREQMDDFHAQMREAGVDYQFVSYAGAVHSFTNPGADAFGIPGVAYQAKADARSWEHMQRLFAETLTSR